MVLSGSESQQRGLVRLARGNGWGKRISLARARKRERERVWRTRDALGAQHRVPAEAVDRAVGVDLLHPINM